MARDLIVTTALEQGIPVLVWPLETPQHPMPEEALAGSMEAYGAELPEGARLVGDVVELQRRFVEAGFDECYMPWPDRHWSVLGHRLVAEWLAPQIAGTLDP